MKNNVTRPETTAKQFAQMFFRFPAALILMAGFAIVLIVRAKVLKKVNEPFAEHYRVILNNNIPILATVLWLLIAVRLTIKFLVPLFQ